MNSGCKLIGLYAKLTCRVMSCLLPSCSFESRVAGSMETTPIRGSSSAFQVRADICLLFSSAFSP